MEQDFNNNFRKSSLFALLVICLMKTFTKLQSEVLQLVSGILHLGNVLFSEVGSETAAVHLDERKISFLLNLVRGHSNNT